MTLKALVPASASRIYQIAYLSAIFDSRDRAARCVSRLMDCRTPLARISISADSSNYRLQSPDDLIIMSHNAHGSFISKSAVCAAMGGAVIAMCSFALDPQWGLLRNLGFFTTLALGAIIGCMFGTLIGSVVGSGMNELGRNLQTRDEPGATVIDVEVEDSARLGAVTRLVSSCGAKEISVHSSATSRGGETMPVGPLST